MALYRGAIAGGRQSFPHSLSPKMGTLRARGPKRPKESIPLQQIKKNKMALFTAPSGPFFLVPDVASGAFKGPYKAPMGLIRPLRVL